MFINLFSIFDWLLVFCVAAFGTLSAFVRDPQIKSVYATVPIPFGLAWLAVGRPAWIPNAMGIFVIWAYVHVVRVLHDRYKVPIVVSIVVGIVFYVALASSFVQAMERGWIGGEPAFIALCTLASLIGSIALRVQRYDLGVAYRTPMKPWAKFLAIFSVVFGLVLIKKQLQGFVTFFPMMNSITSFEARHSLSTQCRQIPAFMVAAGPMLLIMRFMQVHAHYNQWITLLSGVVLYMLIYLPINLWIRKQGAESVHQPQQNS